MTRVTEPPPGETAAPPPRLPGPGRGRRAETVLRVALVLLLLGVAAQGLSGRRHLDWAAISDAPGSTWVGLVLIAAATFVVVASLRTLWRMLRVTRETVDDEAMVSIEGSRVTWVGYLAAAAVIAVAIFLVYLLVRSAVYVPLKLNDPGAANVVGPPANPRAGNLSSTDRWALLFAVLTGGGLAIALMILRRRADLAEEEVSDDEEPSDQTSLAEAVAAAEEVLDSYGDDTRAAIIAAYTAMESQLVASGTMRRASDTPSDFVLRALTASRVSRGAATRLTDLFREARFSRHPMAPTAREDAARALARVADDLAHDTSPHDPSPHGTARQHNRGPNPRRAAPRG
jgi:Domain of unknown function (DUF4129)